MKKVDIITIVDNVNYGTYLQAFATAKIVMILKHKVEIINYIRPYISPIQVAKEYLKNDQMSFLKKWSYAFFYVTLYPYMIWQVKRFLTKRVKMTKKYKSYKDLKKNPPKADIYITGSDQVWNSDYNNGIDKSFFLDFIDGDKYAYAASVGINSFGTNEREDVFLLLAKYRSISVRESFGVDALHEIGLNGVIQVLDPTFLLTKEERISVIKKRSFKKKEKYLLIYSVESSRNELVLKQAIAVAKTLQLKIYWVCPTYKFRRQLNGVDQVFNFASVEFFLELMADADFIIASSFHGTAFAVNFNKQFLTISPGKYNTRVCSLLKLCKLENRYIAKEVVDIVDLDSIDYSSVNHILAKNREDSMNYLKTFLSNKL